MIKPKSLDGVGYSGDNRTRFGRVSYPLRCNLPIGLGRTVVGTFTTLGDEVEWLLFDLTEIVL